MELDDFLTRADQLVALAAAVLSTKHGPRDFPGLYVDAAKFSEFRAAG